MDQQSRADETDATLRRAGILSQSTVRAAVEHLQCEHGISTVNATLAVLRESSRRNNITVQSLAAALLKSDDMNTQDETEVQTTLGTEPPPHLSFSSRGHDMRPDRTLVLQDFMRATITRTGAGFATVQIRDRVHGGLTLVGQQGFDQRFADHFSYVDESEHACGQALASASQVIIADVVDAPEFSETARAVLLEFGIRSLQSTPLLDDEGDVSGMVSTLSRRPHDVPPDSVMLAMRQAAKECTRWLRWYDETVMPMVVMSVHAAASRAARNGDGEAQRRNGSNGAGGCSS